MTIHFSENDHTSTERGVKTLRRYETFVALLVLVATASIAASGVGAQEATGKRVTPDWLTFDAELAKVSVSIVAGLTTVNSGWNFNGYSNGEMTIAVPLNWQVEIHYSSRDANYPHSVGIVEIEDEIPVSGGDATIAFPRAFSLDFVRGMFAPDEDTFALKANKTGRFWLFCGVPGHAKGGMWDYFVVSDEISEPYVEVPADP